MIYYLRKVTFEHKANEEPDYETIFLDSDPETIAESESLEELETRFNIEKERLRTRTFSNAGITYRVNEFLYIDDEEVYDIYRSVLASGNKAIDE